MLQAPEKRASYAPPTECYGKRRLDKFVYKNVDFKVKNLQENASPWTLTRPPQMASCDFGEMKPGRPADFLPSRKIRDIRLVLVSKAP